MDATDNCPDFYNTSQTDFDTNRIGDSCERSPDLVALEGASNQAEFFLGRQDTGFFPPVTIPLGTDPAGVVAGDFTAGDGLADLAVTNRGGDSFQILVGDGRGGLTPGSPVPAGSSPGELVVLEANPSDLDLDGIPNSVDNCPTRGNSGQGDADGDGLGDACSQVEDPDGDFVVTRVELRKDNCPDTYNSTQTDADGDEIGDACDVNPTASNPGDDNDLDGSPDSTDNCPTRYNPDQSDASGNGVGDACDEQIDTDGDGVLTALKIRDNCPDTYNPNQADSDFNSIGDSCEDVQDLALVQEGANSVAVFIQSPPGSWVALPPIPVGNQPRSIVAVDLNGDGTSDLVVSSTGSPPTLTVLLGQGDGKFANRFCGGGANIGKGCLSDSECPGSSCQTPNPDFSTVALPAPVTKLRGGFFRRDVIQGLPEVAAISQTLQNPIVLSNVIDERGDVDGLGLIDGMDLAIWARAFGLVRGNPGYALNADVNLDGKIDGLDLVFIAFQFGQSVPLP
jgi:hypothetical protein